MVHHSRTSVYINAYNAYNKQETIRRRNAVTSLQAPKRVIEHTRPGATLKDEFILTTVDLGTLSVYYFL